MQSVANANDGRSILMRQLLHGIANPYFALVCVLPQCRPRLCNSCCLLQDHSMHLLYNMDQLLGLHFARRGFHFDCCQAVGTAAPHQKQNYSEVIHPLGSKQKMDKLSMAAIQAQHAQHGSSASSACSALQLCELSMLSMAAVQATV